MKRLILLGLLLAGCSESLDAADLGSVDPAPLDNSTASAGVGGGTPGTNGCSNQSEVRQFEVDGKKYQIVLPILCSDQWQDPSDPATDPADIIFSVEINEDRFN